MPGLLRGVARTAVIAGTATTVSNRVSRRQANKWAEQDAQQEPQQQYYAGAAAAAARRTRPTGAEQDMVSQLRELAKLRDDGILTEEEFAGREGQDAPLSERNSASAESGGGRYRRRRDERADRLPRWRGRLSAAKSNSVRVVVVDDSPPFRDLLKDVVDATPGMTCVGALSSGADAIAAVEQFTPDLVIMDKRMPGMDGMEATRQILARRPETVVVLVSVEQPEDGFLADERGRRLPQQARALAARDRRPLGGSTATLRLRRQDRDDRGPAVLAAGDLEAPADGLHAVAQAL